MHVNLDYMTSQHPQIKLPIFSGQTPHFLGKKKRKKKKKEKNIGKLSPLGFFELQIDGSL